MRFTGFALCLTAVLLLATACGSGGSSEGTSDSESVNDTDALDGDKDSEASEAASEDGDSESVAASEDGDSEAASEDGDLDSESQEADSEAGSEAESEEQSEEAYSDDPRACSDLFTPDTIVDLAPAAPDTQIHVSAAFDGRLIWLAFNLPDQANTFDVYGARLMCNGKLAAAPFRVNTTDTNEIDPAVAVSGSRVLYAWQADNGLADRNLNIYTRAYTLGTAVPESENDHVLGLTLGGAAQDVNAWMPQLAALEDGAFLLTGTWADPLGQRWQAFTAHLAADGVAGDVERAPALADSNHDVPTVAASATTSALAYVTSPDEGDSHVMVATRAHDETSFASATDVWPEAATGAPSLSYSPDGTHAYVAFDRVLAAGSETWLMRLNDLGQATHAIRFDTDGAYDHDAVVVATATGGAVLWYRLISGIRQDVYVQAFTDTDGTLALVGTPQKINVNYAVVYAPLFISVGDGAFFAAWSEGTSPKFRLKGRFLRLGAVVDKATRIR